MAIQAILVLFCLFVVEDMAQDITVKIKRFLEVPQYYSSVHNSKKHFGHSFAFDAPTVWNDLPYDVHSAPSLACFKEKLKSYLFNKAFPA